MGETAAIGSKPRISKWDNAKFVLIFLVILGHFADKYSGDSSAARIIFFYIYTFHMPAFIFISGLFSKRTVNADRLDMRKILPYLFLCILLFFYRMLSYYTVGNYKSINILDQSCISWFMLALFSFYIIAHALKDFNSKYVIAISLILAALAGFEPHIGTFLALSRIIVYFPFFYIGYVLDIDKLLTFLNKTYIRIISAVILLSYVLVCIFMNDRIYKLRRLITCQNSYYTLPFKNIYPFGIYRLLFMCFSAVIILAFLSVIPNKNFKTLTVFGSRTLAVYFWHLPVMEWLFAISAYDKALMSSDLNFVLISVASSIVLLLIFSLKIFSIPINYIIKPKKKQ